MLKIDSKFILGTMTEFTWSISKPFKEKVDMHNSIFFNLSLIYSGIQILSVMLFDLIKKNYHDLLFIMPISFIVYILSLPFLIRNLLIARSRFNRFLIYGINFYSNNLEILLKNKKHCIVNYEDLKEIESSNFFLTDAVENMIQNGGLKKTRCEIQFTDGTFIHLATVSGTSEAEKIVQISFFLKEKIKKHNLND